MADPSQDSKAIPNPDAIVVREKQNKINFILQGQLFANVTMTQVCVKQGVAQWYNGTVLLPATKPEMLRVNRNWC